MYAYIDFKNLLHFRVNGQKVFTLYLPKNFNEKRKKHSPFIFKILLFSLRQKTFYKRLNFYELRIRANEDDNKEPFGIHLRYTLQSYNLIQWNYNISSCLFIFRIYESIYFHHTLKSSINSYNCQNYKKRQAGSDCCCYFFQIPSLYTLM